MPANRIITRFAHLLDIRVVRAAVAFLRLNADGTVSQRTAAETRSDLGLGTAATLNTGTTPGTVAAGDDARLTDARTPTTHTHDDRYYTESETDTLLSGKLAASLKGAANGLAELDSGGLVPASQLPSYVDDVIEVVNFAALPVTGATGKIYVTQNDNITYRWSGTAYVEISASLALGETSSTAYRGDRGKTAYDHSQATGNPHGLTKADLSLGNVENTALSSWTGNTSISSLGTITVGIWQGTAIADTYIASAATWNAKVGTTDPRLTDARTPTAHTHPASAITDFADSVAANSAVAANTAKVGAVEYIGGTNALTISAGAVAVNAANGRSQKLTLTADVTSFGIPSNLADGQSMTIAGKQDGTGGRAFTLAAGYVIIGGGLQADISALTANKRFLLAIVRDGSSYLVTIATE